MITFTVHEPRDPAADRLERAEQLVFVKDGFSWVAAFFAPLWMIAHRLWWVLLGYVVLTGVLQGVQAALGVDDNSAGLAMLAVNLLVGFEADTLRRWALERQGWREIGTVSGRTVEECERRFFDGWLPSQPLIAPIRDRSVPPRKWPVIGSLLGAQS